MSGLLVPNNLILHSYAFASPQALSEAFLASLSGDYIDSRLFDELNILANGLSGEVPNNRLSELLSTHGMTGLYTHVDEFRRALQEISPETLQNQAEKLKDLLAVKPEAGLRQNPFADNQVDLARKIIIGNSDDDLEGQEEDFENEDYKHGKNTLAALALAYLLEDREKAKEALFELMYRNDLPTRYEDLPDGEEEDINLLNYSLAGRTAKIFSNMVETFPKEISEDCVAALRKSMEILKRPDDIRAVIQTLNTLVQHRPELMTSSVLEALIKIGLMHPNLAVIYDTHIALIRMAGLDNEDLAAPALAAMEQALEAQRSEVFESATYNLSLLAQDHPEKIPLRIVERVFQLIRQSSDSNLLGIYFEVLKNLVGAKSPRFLEEILSFCLEEMFGQREAEFFSQCARLFEIAVESNPEKISIEHWQKFLERCLTHPDKVILGFAQSLLDVLFNNSAEKIPAEVFDILLKMGVKSPSWSVAEIARKHWDLIGLRASEGAKSQVLPTEAWQRVSSSLKTARHPYESFYLYPHGAYEALAPLSQGEVLTSPLWSPLKPWQDPAFFRVEVEPNPNLRQLDRYHWGFSVSSGRSVDIYLGEEGLQGADKTRWFHLSGVGVGKTYYARQGPETRDGKTSLHAALRRLYLSNLMQFVAAPLGFRSSQGVAIVDRQIIRKDAGSPHVWTEGSIFELRREQLRLMDLYRVINAEKVLTHAKAKLMKEFDWQTLSDAEYVSWFAKTLGEQFAVMTFFNFDHGAYNHAPQLHSGNVSLAGEIFDFDTAKFSPHSQRRYRENPNEENVDHVDMQHIAAMQEAWKKYGLFSWREESKKIYGQSTWLSIFLTRAPEVDFSGILESAFQEKLRDLKRTGVSPRAEMQKFNETVWNPFIKSKKNQVSQVPEKTPID